MDILSCVHFKNSKVFVCISGIPVLQVIILFISNHSFYTCRELVILIYILFRIQVQGWLKYVSGLSVCRMIGVRLLYYPSNNSTNTCREFIFRNSRLQVIIPFIPNHSFYTCRYLLTVIYIQSSNKLSIFKESYLLFSSYSLLFPSHPSHSKYTCRHLDILIYILPLSLPNLPRTI